MNRPLRLILSQWPLAAAAISAVMLAVAHAFQTFGNLAPCELCLKQRTVYWAGLALGVIAIGAGRVVRDPRIPMIAGGLFAVLFLYGAGLAGYHAGVEWKWWPGPTSCTGGGSAGSGALLALLHGAKIRGPQCDVAAWRMLGLSMAGWNALVSLGLAAVSGIAAVMGRDDQGTGR